MEQKFWLPLFVLIIVSPSFLAHVTPGPPLRLKVVHDGSHALNGFQPHPCPSPCLCEWSQESITRAVCDLRNDDHSNRCLDQSDFLSSVQEFELYGCQSLLNLTTNQFGLEKVTTLTLSHGNLESVGRHAFNGLHLLTHLDLSFNQLSWIPAEAFQGIDNLHSLSLSGNPFLEFDSFWLFRSDLFRTLRVLQLDHCPLLTSLHLSQAPHDLSVTNLEVLSASNCTSLTTVCPWLLRSCPRLAKLDLSGCPQLAINPHVLSVSQRGQWMPSLKDVRLQNSTVGCCECGPDVDERFTTIPCYDPNGVKFKSLDTYLTASQCPGEAAENRTLEWFYKDTSVWSTTVLDCLASGDGIIAPDKLTWVTPISRVVVFESNSTLCQARHDLTGAACMTGIHKRTSLSMHDGDPDHISVLTNGSLRIINTGWSDRGRYECITHNSSSIIKLALHGGYRRGLYNLSLVYGFATAGGFMLLTLVFKLIHFLLHNYGCCLFCCCCKNQLPPKAQRLKTALESIEAYRSQQQDKLKENYAQQSEWIRQNCAVQMERVRENYNWQIQNLRDIRHYGSSQLTAVRDQYYEQMSRIRDYSTSQLQRVHENYIFQRQRLRKFSAQNYLKMRETRQYTRRTIHKVMENLPVLYLDLTACRQGLGERRSSIEWDPNADPSQLLELEHFHRHRMQQLQHHHHHYHGDRMSDSVYFTPSGTPLREVGGSSKTTPCREVNAYAAYRAVYSNGGAGSHRRGHSRVRSFSHFLPMWFPGSSASMEAPEDNPNQVRVVVEHEQCGNDYFEDSLQDQQQDHKGPIEAEKVRNSGDDCEESEQLLATVTDSGETKVMMLMKEESSSASSLANNDRMASLTSATTSSTCTASKQSPAFTGTTKLGKSEADLYAVLSHKKRMSV